MNCAAEGGVLSVVAWMQLALAIPSLDELDSFKHSDLQNLAKNLGLWANLRADTLLRALKAHLKREAKKETENQDVANERFSFHDGSQTSAFSCDEPELQTSAQEQADRELLGHGTKTRRRCRTV